MFIKKSQEVRYTAQGTNTVYRLSLFIFCLVLGINLSVPGLAWATTYYVDAQAGNANDGNPGTEAQPWKSLAKAASTAQAGDTVLVKAGTYSETLRPANSGTAGNFITFKAYPGDECQGGYMEEKTNSLVKIDAGGSYAAAVDLQARRYIRIEGFEIANSARAGVLVDDSIQTAVFSGCEIVNNYIHSIGVAASGGLWDNTAGVKGLYVQNLLVENNEIYRIGGYGVYATESVDVVLRGNTIHYVGKDGIQTGSQRNPVPSNILIEFNKLYDSVHTYSHQDAMELWGGYDGMVIRYNIISDFTQLIYISNPNADSTTWGSPDIMNVQIYGNIFYNNKYWTQAGGETTGIFIDGRGNRHNKVRNISIHSNTFGWTGYAAIWILDEDIDGIKMRNNIFYEGGYSLDGGAANIDSNFNLFYNVPSYDMDEEGSQSMLNADPQFVDYRRHQAWNFDLLPTSPAIDSGDPQLGTAFALPVDFKDIGGTERPQGGAYDIGSYESGQLGGDYVLNININGAGSVAREPDQAAYSPGTIVTLTAAADSGHVFESWSGALSGSNNPITITMDSYKAVTASFEEIDVTPPSILSVTVNSPVHILFSEPLDEATATDISNYSISPGITIYSATLEQDLRTVVLTTSDHVEGVEYVLTVNGVKDVAGNPILGATQTYQYNSGLIGYWKLDDGSGTNAADSSGNNHTGLFINTPAWTTGRIDGAVSFDEDNDAIEIAIGGLDANHGTIALWAYAEDLSATRYFFGHTIASWSNRIQLYADQGGLGLGLGDAHATATDIDVLALQTWYYIALTWDGANYSVYVNGIEKASGSYTGLASLNTIADIGNTGNASYRSQAFNGIIDEVRLYGRALTADRVLELYNEAAPFLFEPIDDKTINEGSTLIFDVNVPDPNVVVDINDHNLPSDPCFFYSGGVWTFSWTPTYDDAGRYEVTFEAPHGEYVDFETITITVNNVNRQPLFTPAIGDKSVFEGNELRFTISAIDPDGDSITYSATNLPAGAVFSGDTFTWTPGYRQAGTYQVTFVASDGQDQDSQTITITVKNQNGPPTIAEIGDESVSENSLLSFLISATDPDDDLITYSCPNLPSGAVLTGDTFAWTPTSGQAGVYEVTFVASDGQHQDSQTITISVVDFNLTDPTLVGSWLFDDDLANGALDSSQYGNDGYASLNGYPNLVPGKVGRAYSFDGVNDRVEVPHSPSLNVNKVTLSAWIYVNSYKNDQRITSKETGVRSRDSIYALLLSGKRDKKLQFRLALKGIKKGKRLTSKSTIPLNEWTHVAATFNGKYVRLYINGALNKKARWSESIRQLRRNSNPVYIGDSQFYNRHFDGKIDDVRIYNKALGAAKIAELYGQ
ncbi:MAG: LamG-like jellyroll fold domain-containing protein [Planctomycetota bacterium]